MQETFACLYSNCPFFLFTHWLFRNRLCNFYMFVNFPNSLLLLVYSLRLKNVLCMILILFRVVCSQAQGYSRERSIYTLEECVFCYCMEYSVRSSWFIVLFRSSIFLLIFCLIFRFIIESKVLKFPTVIAELVFLLSIMLFLLHVLWDFDKYICL